MQNELTTSLLLERLNISELTAMQQAAGNAIEKRGDVVLVAPTGSGKTLAFLLPLIRKLQPGYVGVQTLIITPTRELALQIEQVFRRLGTEFKVNSCYGGHSMRIEKKNLAEAPAVLIGTPGRIADHIYQETFSTETIVNLVLDEFDKSLEFGFEKEMSFIIRRVRSIRKRILTSATHAVEIPDFVGLRNPEWLDFAPEEDQASRLTVKRVVSADRDKLESLSGLLCTLGTGSTLVFCNHKESVERVSRFLTSRAVHNDYFHGGMEQPDREVALIGFRNGSTRVLISTDLASRGLDIPEIQHIIHYHLPSTGASYQHRNGRTARMNASGTVYLLLSENEPLPEYIDPVPEIFNLDTEALLPVDPPWVTVCFDAGRKDKINRMDIAGFLMKAGGLDKEEVGRIDVADHSAFAAVVRERAREAIAALAGKKIKNRKVSVRIFER